MSSREAGWAYRLANFYRRHSALELDRAVRIARIEREMQELEGGWRAEAVTHEATCEYCRTGTGETCLKAFTTPKGFDEWQELRAFLGLEEADEKYAEKARTNPVKPRDHKDGFCRYWQNLRVRRMALSDGMCEGGCGKPATDCHHLHYDTLGFEEIGDVRMLCRECHKDQHPWL